MNAGSNRRIFVDPWAGTKTNLKITFSSLAPNTRYTLDTGKKYVLDPAKQLPADISFVTSSETTYTAIVPIDAEKNDYLFLSLVKGDAVTPTPTSTISSPPNPSIPTTSYTFPKGFSTLGVTKSLPTALITTVDGLYVYQFDGPNNKWLMAPTDSFTLEPSKGYYVYNKSDAKSISLPYDTFSINSYSLTKGWNMFHSTNSKQRADIKLTFANQQKTIDELTNQNIINPKVFIIDNDQSKDSCTYFSLLDSTDQSSNCSVSSPKKTRSIPSGKAFWVYVK